MVTCCDNVRRHFGRSIIGIGVLLLLSGVSNAELVAHWPLDDPAGTGGIDSVMEVANGYNGTPTADAPEVFLPDFGYDGAFGTSAEFYQTTIDVPYDEALNPESFTFAAWAQPYISDAGYYSLVTSRQDGVTGGYIIYNNNGLWNFWTGYEGGGWDTLSDGPAVEVGEWQHVAISYDADTSTKSIYFNGELYWDQEGLYDPNPSRDLHIGGGGDAGTQYQFDGAIDDAALWNVALDEDSIAAIVANGAASVTANQVAHWALDDPSGTGGPGSVADSLTGQFAGTTPDPNSLDLEFGAPGAGPGTGSAVEFTNASIDVVYEESLNPESFTVTAWAKSNAVDGQFHSVITSRNDAFPDLEGFILYQGSNGMWQFWTGPGIGAGGWDGLEGPAVEEDEWTHLAISYDVDTNEKTLWVNGEEFTDGGGGSGYAPNLLKDLHIGGGADDGTQFRWNGSIDDVAIFDTVLTEEEVLAIMQFGVGGEGILGDYNNNGVLDAADLDLQTEQIMASPGDLSYDLNDDGQVTFADREIWVNDLKNTWMGDADLDGEFNSSDLVTVFAAGKYESGENASWSEGDWDGDATFGSSDLVAAFASGGYEQGPKAAVSAVPEPGSLTLSLFGIASLLGLVRRRSA